MRDGTWEVESGAVPTLAMKVRIGGDDFDQSPTSWTIRSSMVDNHPLSVDSDPYTTIDVQWPLGADATTVHASALNGRATRAGVPASVALADIDGQRWQVLAAGIFDDASGQASSPGHGSTLVDGIDRLDQPVTAEAVFSSMSTSGTTFQWVGMSSTWALDRVLRAVGFCATPPVVADRTVLAATMMGSMWPEVGTVSTGHAISSSSGMPSWTPTAWGVAMLDGTATYDLAVATSRPCIVLDLVDQPVDGGTGSVQVVQSTADYGAQTGVYVEQSGAGLDQVQWGVIVAGTWVDLAGFVPRSGADRVRVWATSQGTSTMTLHVELSDGRTFTHAHTHAAWSSWVARAARVEATAALGGFVVEDRPSSAGDTLAAARTARHLVSDDTFGWATVAPRVVGRAARAVLDEQAAAECAQWWVDAATGTLVYAHRGVLEDRPSAWTKTTALVVDDLDWSDDLGHLAGAVTVTAQHPHRWISGAHRWDVTRGINRDALDPGEQRTDVYAIPADEDYAHIDLDPSVLTQSTTKAQIRRGTWVGGTHADTATTGDDSEAAWTLGPYLWMPDPGHIEISYQVDPALPATMEVALQVPQAHPVLPRAWQGVDLPIIRARMACQWRDVETTRTTGLGLHLRTVTHDTGRHVQTQAGRDDLAAWLAAAHGAPRATVAVTLDHDPRVEVGDVGTIRDEDRQHVELDMLVTGITATGSQDGARSMTLTGRVLATRGLPVPDPVPDWSAVMAGPGGYAPPPFRRLQHVLTLASLLHGPGKLLVGATETDANLDDPTNQATIARLVDRYDTIVMQDPWWTPVPGQIAAAIRAEAARQGRGVTMLRYVDTCFVRAADTGATLGIVPLSEALARPEWLIHDPGGAPKRAGQGEGYFYNVGSSSLRVRAVEHLTSLLGDRSLWDGIFLDDAVYTLDGLQAVRGTNSIEYPWTVDRSAVGFESTSLAYENDMTWLVAALTDALHAAGAVSMTNYSPGLVDGRDFAAAAADAAPRTIPYQEIYATTWESGKILRPASPDDYDWYWAENHLPVRARVKAWESQGRTYVVNGHANTAGPLGYAFAGWLPWWRGYGAWCGAADDGTGYNSEPLWLPVYDSAASLPPMGPPAVEDHASGVVSRTFTTGRSVTWDPVAGTWTLT